MGMIIPFSRSGFGALPTPAKAPSSGAIEPINWAQVTTRETVQQIAALYRQYASSATSAVRDLASRSPEWPDGSGWVSRVSQQAAAASSSADQAIQSSGAPKIDWTFVRSALESARNGTNLLLATREQADVAYRSWSAIARAPAQVTSYAGPNYTGVATTHQMHDINIGRPAIARSWRVPQGFVVTLYPGAKWTGTPKILTRDTANLGTYEYWSYRVETGSTFAARQQAETALRQAQAQAAAQMAQIEAARQAAELQARLAAQAGDTAAQAQAEAALAAAQAELAAARSEWDAYQAASGGGGAEVSAIESGALPGGSALPFTLEEPPLSKVVLYGAIGFLAWKILS